MAVVWFQIKEKNKTQDIFKGISNPYFVVFQVDNEKWLILRVIDCFWKCNLWYHTGQNPLGGTIKDQGCFNIISRYFFINSRDYSRIQGLFQVFGNH